MYSNACDYLLFSPFHTLTAFLLLSKSYFISLHYYLFHVVLIEHSYFLFCSKLKELSKRTTFIRVTQQINEVFGSTNEEKEEVSMPIELTGNGAQVTDAHVDGGDSKRVKGNK